MKASQAGFKKQEERHEMGRDSRLSEDERPKTGEEVDANISGEVQQK
jgi:hypothetical protein